jgi:hypothetical protein
MSNNLGLQQQGQPATPPRLHHYRFAYELADGTSGTVAVKNPSLIAWDETRVIRKWPEQGDAPNLWQTFIVWHALNRQGEYKGDFKTFKEECDALDMLNSDGESITAKAMSVALERAGEDGEIHAPEPEWDGALIESDPTRPEVEPASP